MKKPRDWLWLSDKYYTKTQALQEFPELQAVDARLPGLMLQVESAEALIEKIMAKAAEEDSWDD